MAEELGGGGGGVAGPSFVPGSTDQRGKSGYTVAAELTNQITAAARMANKLAAHRLNQSISGFPLQMIHDAPMTVADLALSPMLNDSESARIGATFADGWNWLKSRNSSVENPGSGDLMTQNAHDLLTTGKLQVEQAQNTKGGLAGTPGVSMGKIQREFTATARTPDYTATGQHEGTPVGQYNPATDQTAPTGSIDPQQVVDKLMSGLPPGATYVEGDGLDARYKIPGAPSWDDTITLRQFAIDHPELLTVTSGGSSAVYDTEHPGNVILQSDNPNGVDAQRVISQAGVGLGALGISQVMGAGVRGALADMASQVSQNAMGFMNKPFDLLNTITKPLGPAKYLTGLPEANYVVGHAIGGASDVVGGGLTGVIQGKNPLPYMFPAAFHQVTGTGFGSAVVDMMGIPKTSPSRDEIAGVVDIVGQFAVATALGDVMGGAKAATTELPLSEEAQAMRFGRLAQVSYDVTQRIMHTGDLSDILANSRYGRRMLDDWHRIYTGNPDDFVGSLQANYSGRRGTAMMPPDMAKALAQTDGSTAQLGWAANEYYRTIGADRTTLMENIDSIQTRLNDPTLDPTERASLQVQEAIDRSRIATPDQLPPDLIPKPSLVRRITGGAPKNFIERWMEVLYNPMAHPFGSVNITRKVRAYDQKTGRYLKTRAEETVSHPVFNFFNPQALFHPLTKYGFADPFVTDAAPDAMLHNTQLVHDMGANVGLANDRIQHWVSELTNATDYQGTYDAYKGFLAEVQKTLTKRGGDPGAIREYTRMVGDSTSEADYGRVRHDVALADGTTVSQESHVWSAPAPVAGDLERRIALPWKTGQLIKSLPVPNWEAGIDATRIRRDIQLSLRAGGPLQRIAYGASFGLVHGVGDAFTRLKALALTPRSIPIAIRQLIDGGFANMNDPRQIHALRRDKHVAAALAGTEQTVAMSDTALAELRGNPLYEVLSTSTAQDVETLRMRLDDLRAQAQADREAGRPVDTAALAAAGKELDNATKGLTTVTYRFDLPAIKGRLDPLHPQAVNRLDVGSILDGTSMPARKFKAPEIDDPYTRDGQLKAGVIDARIASIRQSMASPEIKQMIQLGSPEAYAAWLDGPGEMYRSQLRGVIGDRTTLEFAQASWDGMQAETSGDVTLQDAYVTGKWYRPAQIGDAASIEHGWSAMESRTHGLMTGDKGIDLQEVTDHYNALSDENVALATQIRAARAAGDTKLLASLVARRVEVRGLLEKAAQDVGKDAWVDMSDTTALSRALADEIKSGNHQLPSLMSFRKLETDDRRALGRGLRRAYQGITSPLRFVSWADMKASRGATYGNVFADEFTQLTTQYGMDAERARIDAQIIAARYAGDLHYDVASRTSAETQLKNIFWFAPVTRQFLTRWTYDLPSKYYWPVGAAIIAKKVDLIADLFKVTGLAHVDPKTGAPVVIIPGTKWGFNPMGFSLGTSKDLGMGLAPLWSAILNGVSEHVGTPFDALHHLNNAIGNYDVSFGASGLNQAWESIFNSPPPWEPISRQAQTQIIRSAQDDASMLATKQYIDEGHPYPVPTDYYKNGQLDLTAYGKAVDAFAAQVDIRMHQIDHSTAFTKLIASVFLPVAIHNSDPNAELWNNYYNTKIQPVPAGPDQAATRSALKYEFLAAHPDLIAYVIPKTQYTDPSFTLPYTDTGLQGFYDQTLTNARSYLPWQSPDHNDYLHYQMGLESWYAMQMQYRSTVEGVAKGDFTNLLKNGAELKSLNANRVSDWSGYLQAINPTFAGMLGEQEKLWNSQAKNGDEIASSLVAMQSTMKAVDALRQIALSTAVDGIRNTDVMKTIGVVIGTLDQTNLPPSSGQYSSDLNWYFNSVEQPYYAKQTPLYAQATAARAVGDRVTADKVYSALRQNSYDEFNRTVTLPDGRQGTEGSLGISPEQVAWGNLLPGEQQMRSMRWAAEPMTWLSPFAIDKLAGTPATPQQWDALTEMGKLNTEASQLIAAAGSVSTRQTQQLKSEVLARQLQIAGSDPSLQSWVKLSSEAPFERLTAFGVIPQSNQSWMQLVSTARQITTMMQLAGISPSSDSARVLPLKAAFFAQVDKFMGDSMNAALLDHLALAFTTGSEPIVAGATLYDRLFFDNWGRASVPDPTAVVPNSLTGGAVIGTSSTTTTPTTTQPTVSAGNPRG